MRHSGWGAVAIAALLLGSPGAAQIVTGVYEGDDAGSRFVHVGADPLMVLVRAEPSDAGNVGSVVRSATMAGRGSKKIESGFTNPLITEGIIGLADAGFWVGAAPEVNGAGGRFSWVAVLPTARAHAGSYVGDGDAGRVVAGVGPPAVVFLIPTNTVAPSFAVPRDGGVSAVFHGSSSSPDIIEALTSDGFQLSGLPHANALGVTYHFVSLELQDGVKTGEYLGNGAVPRRLRGLGFDPQWVVVKIDDTNAVQGIGARESDGQLPVTNATVTSGGLALVADGFDCVNGSGRINEQGKVSIWMGFAGSSVLLDGGVRVVPDGGAPFDGGVTPDGGGAPDGSVLDAGDTDAGEADAGGVDAGGVDASVPDAAVADAGPPDAAIEDAGGPDASLPDASAPDGGGSPRPDPDAGEGPEALAVGCACQSQGEPWGLLVLLVLGVAHGRTRRNGQGPRSERRREFGLR